MGTPEFAEYSLRTLVENGYNIVGVVTMPDKPQGRGHKVQFSPVKSYAIQKDIPVLQPEKLKDPEFVEQLRGLNADLQIVVAFRMLPEVVWAMPPMGTFKQGSRAHQLGCYKRREADRRNNFLPQTGDRHRRHDTTGEH